jgi:Rap1a immunity proteins
MSLRLRCVAGSVLVLVAAAMPLSLAHSETAYMYAFDLDRVCAANDDVQKAVCEGFISGVLEIISNGPVEGIAACAPPPPQMTLSKAISVVRKWLADHSSPEEVIQPASLAVAHALTEAFPCK